jgi:hypothetical protein
LKEPGLPGSFFALSAIQNLARHLQSPCDELHQNHRCFFMPYGFPKGRIPNPQWVAK